MDLVSSQPVWYVNFGYRHQLVDVRLMPKWLLVQILAVAAISLLKVPGVLFPKGDRQEKGNVKKVRDPDASNPSTKIDRESCKRSCNRLNIKRGSSCGATLK